MEKSAYSFWAKTNEANGTWHNLVWHLIDSGTVAQTLWNHSLSGELKRVCSDFLSIGEAETRGLLSFWISMHDIGKAGPAFQGKWDAGKKRLIDEGFSFPEEKGSIQGYHGHATTMILSKYWKQENGLKKRFQLDLALALGGHHGEFPAASDIVDNRNKEDHLGDQTWGHVRNELIELVKVHFSPPEDYIPPMDKIRGNALLMLISGLTTTADWIASNVAFFPFDDGSMTLDEYSERSINHALKAVQDLGWTGWKASGETKRFEEMFPKITPNKIQSSFLDVTKDIHSPFLCILEAPTGSGKTELGLYLADNTVQNEGKSGFYVAMPSQATSNQMFERTTSFLARRYQDDTINVLLVHGAAMIREHDANMRMQGIGQDDQHEPGNVISAEWFLPRKKSLLAPFGIGTVDQTFLSVMRCKHFFLRLFGLADKVILFDEVHAYDVYMLEIFKHLLHWLRAINTSIIILSATLPKKGRHEMLSAYSGGSEGSVDTANQTLPFPRVSISTAEGIRSISLGETPSREIAICWLDEEALVDTLQGKLAGGGNAAVICNRVDHTLEIYERLSAVFPPDELIVFHSRFPYAWRAEIETNIKERYGKDRSKRPQRSIVVATQVIEQSLDLDFDLMVSDLAPVDLLIQRAGRLQRHPIAVGDFPRPEGLKEPGLILLKPEADDDLPGFRKDGSIYEPYILQRTWYALRNMKSLFLPAQTDELIEKVYSEDYVDFIPEDVWAEMQTGMKRMLHKDAEASLKAAGQLIQNPSQRILGCLTAGFADEHDPASHSVMQTLTRNSRPSVQIVCLCLEGEQLYTLDAHIPVDIKCTPDHATQVACLKSSVSLSNPAWVHHFLAQPVPSAWRKCAALRNHIPVKFAEDGYQNGDHTLTLDRIMGIVQR